ncbi:hypothetical protein M514_00739 [Trichuris suis]|uniref:Uncharacterized protein n=1 Tax=Trichuris suis TaxID=68888 RepID=A0A085N6P9_9BILA|nr:hypothetical protein M513_00739 [Trichuris suis]KFD65145.1 hypothetical protein M514_00739 [Trichuris suis]
MLRTYAFSAFLEAHSVLNENGDWTSPPVGQDIFSEDVSSIGNVGVVTANEKTSGTTCCAMCHLHQDIFMKI